MEKYIEKPYITEALKALNFQHFTPIQEGVFALLANQKSNLLIKGKTGSGKTHSYLIPIFNKLDPNLNYTQALIIAPTALLARQIANFTKDISKYSPQEIRVKVYTQDTDRLRDLAKIQTNQPHIVISTPGKVVDYAIKENVLKIHKASYFVIDEADMIADGFLNDVLALAAKCNLARKIILSATFSLDFVTLYKKLLPNVEYVDYDLSSENKLAINHYLIPAKDRDKFLLLEELIKIVNPFLCIVFCNKKPMVAEVYQFLKTKGYNVATIHGDMSNSAIKFLQKEVSKLKYQFIVGSDIMARGIDIEGVSCVINFDLPKEYEFYIHRTGRTGRMDFSGDAYSFWERDSQKYYESLKQKGISFTFVDIKDGLIIPYTPRTERVKVVDDKVKAAVKRIPKPKTVKPGYKKKYQAKVAKAVQTAKRRQGK